MPENNILRFPTLGPVRWWRLRFNAPVTVEARDVQDVVRALEAAGIRCPEFEAEPLEEK